MVSIIEKATLQSRSGLPIFLFVCTEVKTLAISLSFRDSWADISTIRKGESWHADKMLTPLVRRVFWHVEKVFLHSSKLILAWPSASFIRQLLKTKTKSRMPFFCYFPYLIFSPSSKRAGFCQQPQKEGAVGCSC